MNLPESLFEKFQSLSEIQGLIGKTEDLILDFKEWPQRDDEQQRMLANAFSGFSNANGGVLLIGVEARSKGKDDPDVVQSLKPVPDAVAVKAKIENLVGNLIEPPSPGIRVAHVLDSPPNTGGYVLIYIPETDGPPVRSRKHRDFFVRVSAGTLPLEYFQLLDMFGRRQRPVLSLWAALGRIRSEVGANYSEREFVLGIEYSGRAIARFPSLRFTVMPGINLASNGLGGTGKWGLPLRATSEGTMLFGGGADDVVFPGTHLEVVKLLHRSRASKWMRPGARSPQQYFLRLLST